MRQGADLAHSEVCGSTSQKTADTKAMNDPRLAADMKGKPMPFDIKRMAYGGFKALVSA